MKKLFIILSLLLSLSMGQDYSLSFDGVDDYVDCGGASSNTNTENAITIGAWIRTSSTPDEAGLVAKGTGFGTGIMLRIRLGVSAFSAGSAGSAGSLDLFEGSNIFYDFPYYS